MWKITFFVVWNWVRIWRNGRHTPTKNFQEYPPPPTSGTKCTLTRVHVCTWCSMSLWSNEEGNSPDNESLKRKVPAHLLAIQYRLKRLLFTWFSPWSDVHLSSMLFSETEVLRPQRIVGIIVCYYQSHYEG